MTELVERARCGVLDFFHASPDEDAVIFTANASLALKLVGEAYPFQPRGEAFEDGTPNYLSLPAVEIGLKHLHDLRSCIPTGAVCRDLPGYLPAESDLPPRLHC